MSADTLQVNTLKGRSQRRFPRFTPRVRLSAIFRVGNTWVEGEVASINECGFLLAVKDGGAADNEGSVTIKFPEFFIHSKGYIRSVLPGQGLGIELLDLSSKDRKLLAAYCNYLQQLTKARPA